MVKFKGYLNPHGQIYLASEIRRELNTKKVDILGNAKAILIYPEGTDLKDVLRSLDIIKSDLEHRRDLKQKNNES